MNNKSVQYGIIGGLVGLITTLLTYLFFVESSAKPFGPARIIGWLVLLILIYLMYRGAADKKLAQGGFISFKSALKESFLVGVVATVIGVIVNLIARFLLFPESYNRIMELTMNAQEAKMEAKGLSEEQIEASIKMIEKFADVGFYLQPAISLIIIFIIALIIAAIVQRKNPDLV